MEFLGRHTHLASWVKAVRDYRALLPWAQAAFATFFDLRSSIWCLGFCRAEGDAPGLGELAVRDKAGPASREEERREGGGIQARQVVQTSLQRFLRKGATLGGLGPGQVCGRRPIDPVLKTLTKLTLRLEEEMGRFRADTCFMLFVDTVTEQNTLQLLKEAAQGWQTAFEAGTVTTSLRIILLGGLLAKLKEVLEQVNTDDGLRGRLMTVGWLLEGATALTPTWSYYRWDPAARKQVKDERPPLAHDRALHCVEALQRTLCDPAVLLRFQGSSPLGDGNPCGGCSVQDGYQPEGPGLHGGLHGPLGPVLLGGPQASGTPPTTRRGCRRLRLRRSWRRLTSVPASRTGRAARLKGAGDLAGRSPSNPSSDAKACCIILCPSCAATAGYTTAVITGSP